MKEEEIEKPVAKKTTKTTKVPVKQSEPKTLLESLVTIQSELKAPKGLRNTFGNYNYRSAENILEAVKPLLTQEKCVITLSDSIEMIGNRFYVVAVALFENLNGESMSVKAYAREEEQKKGMDGSQVTGASSSYARKYALNGLLLIDDTKDADTDEHAEQMKKGDSAAKPKTGVPKTEVPVQKPWLNQGEELKKVKIAIGTGKKTLEAVLNYYNVNKDIKAELEAIVVTK